ncbi:MAG: hypothetical protein AB7P01_10505 [Bacteroidia bacterium]
MNTQLLNQNNTTCTTKNLKMMAAVICITAVFVFTNAVVFAQGISNSEGKTAIEQEAAKQKWVEEHRDELNKTNAPAVVKPAPVQTKAAVVATEKQAAVKNVTPVTSAKQVVTPQSAETVDNAVNVKTPAVDNSNSVEAKQAKTLAEQRTTRSSSVAVRNEVKPYDKSTVVNEVNHNVTYPVIPGFVATGNADVDAKAFEVAKTNLQQSNPAEYTKYFSEKE